MFKIMKPVDLFQTESRLDQKVLVQEQQSIEQFITQLDKMLIETATKLFGDITQGVFAFLGNSITKEAFLGLLFEKLTQCTKLAEDYLVITEAIGSNDHKTEIARFFHKAIPHVVQIVKTLNGNDQDEQEKIEDFTKNFQELSSIIETQNIGIIISGINISELLEIVKKVGAECDTPSATLEKIQAYVSNTLAHKNPQKLAFDYVKSVSDLMIEAQLVINNKTLADTRKAELIKAFVNQAKSLDTDTKEYVLQLGCELLNLGDPQGALEIFAKSPGNISPESQIKLKFDKALALAEIGGQDNCSKSATMLEQLLQEKSLDGAIERDKVLSLLVVALDKQGKYEEAKSYYEQVSRTHQPDSIFEKFALLKYGYKRSTEEGINQSLTLINDMKAVKDLLEEANDPDFWYLAGAIESSQNNLLKANEYFKQALRYLDTKKSMLITEASDSLFQILYVGTKARDSDVISKVKTKYTESIDTQKEVLFEFVRTGDKASVEFLISQGIDINITNASKVIALSIACESNNFGMVNFLLSKNINFDTTSIIGLKPFQAAAIRIAHEDGDVRILEALLKKYQDTNTDLSDEILQDVDCRMQQGPSYLQESYRHYVEEILNKKLVDSTGGTEDWANYSDWWN